MYIALGLLQGIKKQICENIVSDILYVPIVPACSARLINDGSAGADSEEDDILVAQSIFQSLLIER